MAVISTILLVLFVIVSLALIFAVAIQSESNSGLSGVFGGNSDSAFGGQSNKVMNKITAILLIAFIVLAVLVAIVNRTPEVSLLGTSVK